MRTCWEGYGKNSITVWTSAESLMVPTSKVYEARAADDDGYGTHMAVEQEESCTRHKLKLGCDACDRLEEVTHHLMDLPHKHDNLSKEAQAPNVDLHTSDVPLEREASCSALKERIACEAVNKLMKAVEELEMVESESDSLNKKAHAADNVVHTTDTPVVQEEYCTRHKVKLGCDGCDQLKEVIHRLTDLHLKHDNVIKEAHAADDEGHGTDMAMVQEESCTRHKLKLGCDGCDQLKEVFHHLMDLPPNCHYLSEEAQSVDTDLHVTHLPLEEEASSSASEERIMRKGANNLEKAVQEVEKVECESDSLNKESSAMKKNLLTWCSVGLIVLLSVCGLHAIGSSHR